MTKICLTGDTHGDIDIQKIIDFAKNHKELTKNDYLIVLGDFGVPWHTPYEGHLNKSDKRILKMYEEFPFTTLFIDGNHENHDALNKYECEVWNGGKVQKINDSVIHLCRGQVFTIDGHKFFTLGGAESVDKCYRTPGKSWWPEESISYDDLNESADNLSKVDFKVDYILTHDMPSKLMDKYFNLIGDRWNPSASSKALDNIYDNTEYSYWFFGHHHKGVIDGVHVGLYNQIIDIDCFKPVKDQDKELDTFYLMDNTIGEVY